MKNDFVNQNVEICGNFGKSDDDMINCKCCFFQQMHVVSWPTLTKILKPFLIHLCTLTENPVQFCQQKNLEQQEKGVLHELL